MDLTLPRSKKRKLTDYFTPASTPTRGMPHFLQQYNPQRSAIKRRDLFQDDTGGGPSREGPSAISGPSTSHNNPGECSTVNKTYTLAKKLELLQYVCSYSEAEAARYFEIPRTTIRGWKGLDRQPIDRKKSRKRKGKNKSWS